MAYRTHYCQQRGHAGSAVIVRDAPDQGVPVRIPRMGTNREVLEWPYTMGGGGATPPRTPTPPQTKVTIVGENEIGKILLCHSWYTNSWVPDPPFPPLLMHPQEPSITGGVGGFWKFQR